MKWVEHSNFKAELYTVYIKLYLEEARFKIEIQFHAFFFFNHIALIVDYRTCMSASPDMSLLLFFQEWYLEYSRENLPQPDQNQEPDFDSPTSNPPFVPAHQLNSHAGHYSINWLTHAAVILQLYRCRTFNPTQHTQHTISHSGSWSGVLM